MILLNLQNLTKQLNSLSDVATTLDKKTTYQMEDIPEEITEAAELLEIFNVDIIEMAKDFRDWNTSINTIDEAYLYRAFFQVASYFDLVNNDVDVSKSIGLIERFERFQTKVKKQEVLL